MAVAMRDGGQENMDTDTFNLRRFLDAQRDAYPTALAELRRGRKQSHWIWFVLPQLKGLGSSGMAERYGISGLAEARAYLAHPVLGARLTECVEAILQHRGVPADVILGDLDALKFRSCLTLFAQADPSSPLFARALAQCFGGATDPRTLALLGDRG